MYHFYRGVYGSLEPRSLGIFSGIWIRYKSSVRASTLGGEGKDLEICLGALHPLHLSGILEGDGLHLIVVVVTAEWLQIRRGVWRSYWVLDANLYHYFITWGRETSWVC